MLPDLIGGRYRPLRELGRGGMGAVFLVDPGEGAPPLALKVLLAGRFSESGLRHFEQEFRTLADLEHPHLTAVDRFGRVGLADGSGREVPYFTMEYVEGQPLDTWFREAGGDLVRLYPALAQIGGVLGYLHDKGLVHRDVKPSNILVTGGDAEPAIKLMDLGLAGPVDDGAGAGRIRGTAAYLAPEAARGAAVDPRSDLYGLGCVIYELLTGKPPFRGASALSILRGHLQEEPLPPSSLRRDVPPAFEGLVLQLLRKNPGERPASADRFLERLDEIAGGTLEISAPAVRRRRVLGGGFVGRERELGRMARRAEACRAGESHAALLVGEAGVGKSQLVREFRLRAEIDGFDVHVGRPEFPGGALVSALVEAAIAREGPDSARLRQLRGGAEGDGEAPPLTGSALHRLLGELAAQRPFALAVEDLHLADETTCNLLAHCLEAGELERLPGLFLIGTYRGDEVSRASPLFDLLGGLRDNERVAEWFVDPLSATDTASLVRARCGANSVPPAVLSRLLEETGGNPFHVGELLADLAEEGHIRPGAEKPFDETAFETLQIPGKVRDLIDRRLARLGESSAAVLRAGAVLGSRILDPDGIAAITGLRWEHVLRELIALLPGGLVLREDGDDGPLYRFAGDGIAVRIRDRTPAEEASALHARTLSYLERRGIPRHHTAWSDFARHAEDAGRPGQAVDAFARAGELAALRHANREAVALYGRAIDLSAHQASASTSLLCGLYHARGALHERVGDLERAEEDYRWLIARAEKGGDSALKARGHVALASVLTARSRHLDAQDNAELAFDLAEELDDPALTAAALLALGRAAERAGDSDGAGRRLEDALEAARRSSDHELELQALLARGDWLRHHGDPKGALAAFREAEGRLNPETPVELALDIRAGAAEATALDGDLEGARSALAAVRGEAEGLGHAARVAAITSKIGLLRLRLGDPAGAGRELERGLELHRRLGLPEGAVGDLHLIAEWHVAGGRFEPAREAALEALEQARRIGKETLIAASLGQLARLHLDIGDADGAAPLLEEARRLVDEARTPAVSARLRIADGDGQLLAGRHEPARRHFQEAAFLSRRTGDGALEATALVRLGETHLDTHDYDRARVSAKRALAVAEGSGLPRESADARLLRARVELERPGGDLVTAEVDALAALETYRGARARERVWRAEYVAGRAELRLARGDEAAERIGRAHDYLEEVRSRLGEDWARAFVDKPARREVYDDWARLRERDDPAVATERPGGDRELARMRRENEALKTLLEINRRLHANHEIEELLGVILDAALELTGAERAFLLVRDAAGNETRETRHAAGDAPSAEALTISESIAKRAIESREPLLSTDAEADQRFRGYESVHDLHIRSVLVVPLPDNDRRSGAIYLDSRVGHRLFTPFHLELAQRLADQAAIALGTAQLMAEIASGRSQVDRLNRELEETVSQQREELSDMREMLSMSKTSFEMRYRFEDLIGASYPMQKVYHLIERLAPKRLPVLVTGDSGTGKELIARAIHAKSGYSSGPFFTVNCAAVNETLLESELFGYRKGAFTGADRDKPGYFELASGGTLFLDEVGEMGAAMQAKLLRAIERGEVLPVGGKAPRKVDVRIVTATHRDLEAMIRDGGFREDLFYRFNVGRIHIPPLRERREDIPLLVDHFLQQLADEEGEPKREIEAAAIRRLAKMPWSGNVRELQHRILRISAFASGSTITLKDVVRYGEDRGDAAGVATTPAGDGNGGDGEVQSLEALEKQQILRALEQTGGNKTRAAQILGINRATLFRKLKRLELDS